MLKLFKIEKLKQIKNSKKFLNKIKRDNISGYAAETTYFTILSFIPFIIFLLTLIKFTNINKEIIFTVFKEFLPSSIHVTIFSIIDEIYLTSKQAISFSLIIVLWSAGKGFSSLNKGLKKIYCVEDKRKIILRIQGSIYTFFFIIAIIIFLFLILLGKELYIFIMSNFQQISQITYFLYNFRVIFCILIMYYIFIFLYSFISQNEKNNYKHIYGALFSSISWQIISFIFSRYLEFFDGITSMYGSLSSMILIMLWVYVSMYIIFLGAEINIFFKKDNIA